MKYHPTDSTCHTYYKNYISKRYGIELYVSQLMQYTILIQNLLQSNLGVLRNSIDYEY